MKTTTEEGGDRVERGEERGESREESRVEANRAQVTAQGTRRTALATQ